jgi:hypothetical protein
MTEDGMKSDKVAAGKGFQPVSDCFDVYLVLRRYAFRLNGAV